MSLSTAISFLALLTPTFAYSYGLGGSRQLRHQQIVPHNLVLPSHNLVEVPCGLYIAVTE